MHDSLPILLITAVSIGFMHTILGPDHYIPFIVMAKARKWTLPKTIWITVLCGIGHIGSSILLGIIGVICGIALAKLEPLESFRSNIAGWALIAFGLVYFIWGLRQAVKNKSHQHIHFHKDGEPHIHEHGHVAEHAHAHEKEEKANITPWVLFTIFVFGPCEPLMPILMYPAAQKSVFDLVAVTVTFGLATISTMIGVVAVSVMGINFLPVAKFEKYTNAIAGLTIFLCGAAIQFLGL